MPIISEYIFSRTEYSILDVISFHNVIFLVLYIIFFVQNIIFQNIYLVLNIIFLNISCTEYNVSEYNISCTEYNILEYNISITECFKFKNVLHQAHSYIVYIFSSTVLLNFVLIYLKRLETMKVLNNEIWLKNRKCIRKPVIDLHHHYFLHLLFLF